MKVILDSVLEDWREDLCARCNKECNPAYRFCYSTDKQDINESSLADFEIISCRSCCGFIDKSWKDKCDDISSVSSLIKTGGIK